MNDTETTSSAAPDSTICVSEDELASAIHATETFAGFPGCGWQFDASNDGQALCTCRERARNMKAIIANARATR